MSWKDLYTKARIKSGTAPLIKEDFYKIMSEAVKTVDADPELKKALQVFLKPYAFSEYKAASSYKWATIIAPTFVQWLSEDRKKTITISDFEPPDVRIKGHKPWTLPDDVQLFAQQYSDSEYVQAQVRSYLFGFGHFLVSRYHISTYPFGGLKVGMPKGKSVIVYNEEMLDDFYNVLLAGAPGYFILFFRLLLETGQRPGHVYYLTCGDIEYNKPQKDALDRTFYPIFFRNMLTREKLKIKETITVKGVPEAVYISENLKNDIKTWCDENKLTGTGYVFKDFVAFINFKTFIRRRKKSPNIISRLKHKDVKYILYGLRHTWTSVMYAVTKDIGDLIDLGGWAGVTIPLTVYRNSMKTCDALAIAKKWEVYLPPDKKDDVLELQGRCERKEEEVVPGAPTVSKQQFDDLAAMVAKLEKKLAEKYGS